MHDECRKVNEWILEDFIHWIWQRNQACACILLKQVNFGLLYSNAHPTCITETNSLIQTTECLFKNKRNYSWTWDQNLSTRIKQRILLPQYLEDQYWECLRGLTSYSEINRWEILVRLKSFLKVYYRWYKSKLTCSNNRVYVYLLQT